MPERDILDLLGEYEGTGTNPLPTELPEGFENEALKPMLAPPGRELEEYRVRIAAQEAGIDPDIAAAVAFQESGFNPEAVSPTGVKGTMQVTKPTAYGLGFDRDNPEGNIRAGIQLLKQGLETHPQDIKKALSIYPAPKDRRRWIPSVLSHSIRAKENRLNSLQTIEDIEAQIPEDTFQIIPQEAPLNVPGSQITNVNQELGVTQPPTSGTGRMVPGPLGTEVPLPSWGQMGSDIATIASILGGGPAIKGMETAVSKIPWVAKALTPVAKEGITKLPKMGQAIKTAIQSLYGGGAGAGIQVAGGEPEKALEAGIVGATVPVALKGLGEAVKTIANKVGDITVGKWNVGRFVNEKFGITKSMKDLKIKNTAAKGSLEQDLQNQLSKYDDIRLPLDTKQVDKRTLQILRQRAVKADDKLGIEMYNNFISRYGDKGELIGNFTPSELNIIKRNMYDLSYSYRGDIKTGKEAKIFKEKAQYLRKLIEDNTDDSIRIMNEEYAKHIQLGRAVDHKLNVKPGSWSWVTGLASKAAVAGGAGAVGGGIPGMAVGAAAQTVPGFTGIGAAGRAIENPELVRILSILLPQWLQNEGE